MNALTLPTTVADLVREHDEKFAAINAEIAAFEDAMTRLEMAATVQGTFADAVIHKRPYIHASDLSKNLRISGWKAVYNRLQIDRIASAKDKALFERTITDPPEPKFNRVVMNPPFYGKHYLKHIRHALKFLKPGGTLVSILPATAWYDHGIQQEFPDATWSDLPVASFSEAGTNVPTGIFKIIMRAAQ